MIISLSVHILFLRTSFMHDTFSEKNEAAIIATNDIRDDSGAHII